MKHALLLSIGAAGFVFAASLVSCAGCGGDSSGTPPADAAEDHDVAPPCTESWCSTVTEFCSRWIPQCLGSGATPDVVGQEEQGCRDGIGATLRSTADPASGANTLVACGNTAATCDDFYNCLPHPLDAGTDADTAIDGDFFADTQIYPPDVVPQQGDDPNCVRCAVQQCPSAGSGLCFVDPVSDPRCNPDGSTFPDCCAEYRYCLSTCLTKDPDAGAEYAACVASVCDPGSDAGKSQFEDYAACMASHCASCGSDAGTTP